MAAQVSEIMPLGEPIPADKIVWEQSGLSPLQRIDPAALSNLEDSLLKEFDRIDVLCYAGLGEKIRTFSEQYHVNFPVDPRPFSDFPNLQKIQSLYTQQQETFEKRRRKVDYFTHLPGYVVGIGTFIGGAIAGGELSNEYGRYIASIVAAFTGVASSIITVGLLSRFNTYVMNQWDGRQQKRETDLEQQLLDTLNSYRSTRKQ